MGEVRGFSVSWARAVAAAEAAFTRRPLTEGQKSALARLFHAARHERGFDWLPNERETDALVRQARQEGEG